MAVPGERLTILLRAAAPRKLQSCRLQATQPGCGFKLRSQSSLPRYAPPLRKFTDLYSRKMERQMKARPCCRSLLSMRRISPERS